jgi:hypothetical protein
MKKLTALIFTAVLAVGAAFADHPKGWGIGVVGTYGIGLGYGGGGPGVGLSLKIPSIPVFWGVGVGFGSKYFSLDVTGDFYIIDRKLVPEANLHWFWGFGGFFDFRSYNDKWYGNNYSYTDLALGARMPIGISWQPINWFEVFLNGAPSVGLGFWGEGKVYNNVVRESSMGLFFTIPVNIGLRVWL